MTIRLPDELAGTLEFVARVDDMPLAEAIRAAVAAHIAARRADPQFQAKLRQVAEQDQSIARRLADGL